MFLSSTQTHHTYDMQHDLQRSLRDLDLRSTFEADLSRSNGSIRLDEKITMVSAHSIAIHFET